VKSRITELKPALVVLPCHNEEIAIGDTIKEIKRKIRNCEIWVIDNRSTDKTAEIAAKLGARIIYESQKGKGFAIRRAVTNFNPKNYRVVFMTDGDHTYSLEAYEEAEDLILRKNFDLVIGRRIVNNNSEHSEKREEVFRRGHTNGNKVLSIISRFLFKVSIPDTLSGWRVMNVGFFASFTGGVSGFQIESEMNVHAYRLQASVASVDVKYLGRKLGSKSKLSTIKDGTKILIRQIVLFHSERPFLAFNVLSIYPLILGSILFRNVLINYLKIREVPNFPSLIVSVGCFSITLLLITSGIILQNVRISRVEQTRRNFIEANYGK
jgi:glycosyltransferase involved in cell wall biosynthesis